MSEFFDVDFFQALVSGLISVFVGAGLGVPLGLWVDRRSQRTARSIAAQNRKERERREEQQIFAAVRKSVEHNCELLRQAREALSPGSGYNVIFFNVDPRSIDVLMPQLIERSERFDLIDRVNNFRYQLEHISRKIDTQYELIYGSTAREGDEQRQRRDEIIRSLHDHFPSVQQEGTDIVRSIAAIVDEANDQVGTQPSPVR